MRVSILLFNMDMTLMICFVFTNKTDNKHQCYSPSLFTLVRRVLEIHQGHLASCNQDHSGLSKESLKWYYISAIFSTVLNITSSSLHFPLSVLSPLPFLYSFQLLVLFVFLWGRGVVR